MLEAIREFLEMRQKEHELYQKRLQEILNMEGYE
jgi:hypothetical protein